MRPVTSAPQSSPRSCAVSASLPSVYLQSNYLAFLSGFCWIIIIELSVLVAKNLYTLNTGAELAVNLYTFNKCTELRASASSMHLLETLSLPLMLSLGGLLVI